MKFIIKFSEIFPAIIFIVLFYIKDIFFATAGIVTYAIISSIILVIYKIPNKQVWITNILIISLGGLSLISDNAIFIKMKPTAIYILFANVIFWTALFNKPVIKNVLQHIMNCNDVVWQKNSFVIAAYFILCAILNEVIWRNFSDQFWINFKVFGLSAITFMFFILFLFCNKKHIKINK